MLDRGLSVGDTPRGVGRWLTRAPQENVLLLDTCLCILTLSRYTTLSASRGGLLLLCPEALPLRSGDEAPTPEWAHFIRNKVYFKLVNKSSIVITH